MSAFPAKVDQDKLDKALSELDNWYDNALKSGGGFKSEEERQAYLASIGDIEKHPMFATETEDLEGHPLVEAIRAIKEEDKTNTELAIMYKDEGNEFMKMSQRTSQSSQSPQKQKQQQQKNLHEAYDRYTHAMTFLEAEITERYQKQSLEDSSSNNNPTVKSSVNSPPLSRSLIYQQFHLLTSEQRQLFSQLYSNRAATSLLLQNYGQVKQDCLIALKIWKENSKAYIRYSKALFLLKQYQDCLDFTKIALEILQQQQQTTTTTPIDEKERQEIFKQINELQSYHQKSIDILHQTSLKQNDIYLKNWKELSKKWMDCYYLHQQLGLQLSYFSYQHPEPIQLKDSWPHYHGSLPLTNTINTKFLSEEELSQITWPILFLYPQYNQLDIIPDANINNIIVDYLAMMFPEPEDNEPPLENKVQNPRISWDLQNEYHISNLVIYVSLQLSNYVIRNPIEWLISCLEYYSLFQNGSIEFMKYAIKEIIQDPLNERTIAEIRSTSSNITTTTTAPRNRVVFNSNYQKYFDEKSLNDMKLEDIQQLVKVTEDNMNMHSLKKSQQLATSSVKTNRSPQFYYEIQLGYPIYSILQAVCQYQGLPRGTLSFIVFPRSSKAHRTFLQKNQNEGIPVLQIHS